MKYYFIINEHARGHHSEESWKGVDELLRQHRVEYEQVKTEYPRHGVELAQKFADQHPEDWVIVAVGGDGTLMEVTDGVHHSQNDVPVGYVPAGSGNDFARSVGISLDPYKAVQQILAAKRPVILDVGAYQNLTDHRAHAFNNNFGIGFDANVVHEANQDHKSKLGKFRLQSLAYLSAMYRAFHQQEGFPLQIKIDDVVYDFQNAFLMSVTNIKYFGGGVKIAPQAVMTDGMLDVVITEKMSFRHFIKLFSKLVMGGKHLEMPDVFVKAGHEIYIKTTTKEYGQFNGEDTPRQIFELKLWTMQQKFWF